MNEIEFSSQVKMKPWIGINYFSSKIKMRILGESLYDVKATKNSIIKQVQGIREETWTWAYFTKIKNVFNLESDTYTNSVEKESFWNSVCYYEYLTHAMHEAKEKVPAEYWEEAKEPFIEVVEKLKPTVVVCIGFDTFNHLPLFGEEHGIIKISGIDDVLYVWKYNVRIKSSKITKPVYVCKIRHPSAPGFTNENWFKLFRKFLKTL